MSKRYFEFKEGASSKFWEVTVDECTVTARYGKIGTAGQSTVKEFDDEDEAQTQAEKQVAEKTKKGYVELEAAAGDDGEIAVDGSELGKIIGLLGGTLNEERERAGMEKLEALLGTQLPEETREFLSAGGIDLIHPSADHPEVDSFTSLERPAENLAEWLEALARPTEGPVVAMEHFCGLSRIGVQLQYGDYMWALASIESYNGGKLGGAFYWDENDFGQWGGGSISGLLMQELDKFWSEYDGAVSELEEDERDDLDTYELSDCFILSYDCTTEPPVAKEMPAEIKDAFQAFYEKKRVQLSRQWVAAFCGGTFSEDDTENLPSAEEWAADKALVGSNYADAMYWLMAHALLDNQDELAEALELTAKHPSKNVQVLRDYIQNSGLGATYGTQRDRVLKMLE